LFKDPPPSPKQVILVISWVTFSPTPEVVTEILNPLSPTPGESVYPTSKFWTVTTDPVTEIVKSKAKVLRVLDSLVATCAAVSPAVITTLTPVLPDTAGSTEAPVSNQM